jgi:hypothetical protein
MRLKLGVACVLVLLAAAGCGKPSSHPHVATAGGTARPAGTATPGAQNEQEQALRFARCMRENGVPNFPDPKFENGGISIDTGEGANPAAVQAATDKCKQYLPNGGVPHQIPPQDLEKLRKFAQCMREHGVPKFPDPTDQGMQVNGNELGVDPTGPTFQAAQKACEKYQPVPPSGAAGQRFSGNNG